MISPEEHVALCQLAAERQTVVWDKPQARDAFEAIDAWFQLKKNDLHTAIENALPEVLSEQQKCRFVTAFMQIRATGIPPRRTAPGYFDDWREVLAELRAQTDRGAAIVGAAILDTRLEKAFRVFFVHGEKEAREVFDGPAAPMGTLAAKARVAHALGLLGDDSFKDLNIIKKIRNTFSHDLTTNSFHEAGIASDCAGLRLANCVFQGYSIPSDPRERFIQSVVNIMQLMYSEIVAGSNLGEAALKSP